MKAYLLKNPESVKKIKAAYIKLAKIQNSLNIAQLELNAEVSDALTEEGYFVQGDWMYSIQDDLVEIKLIEPKEVRTADTKH